MNINFGKLPWLACLVAPIFLLGLTGTAPGASFDDQCTITGDPDPPCCDDTNSLGAFWISVHRRWHPMMAGYPGYRYDPVTRRGVLQSPPVYDPDTLIGRSVFHWEDDNADTGAIVGGAPGGLCPPVTVGDWHMVRPPAPWPADLDVLGREVHLAMYEMDLCAWSGGASMPPCVRVGHTMPECNDGTGQCDGLDNLSLSPGEVEAPTDNSDPNQDFIPAAQGFFNIYAEVELPPAAQVLTTIFLHNDKQRDPPDPPMMLINPFEDDFPPTTPYIHGRTNAVRVRFKNDSAQWNEGDLFGYLIVAGHGTRPSTVFCETEPGPCACPEVAEICAFEAKMGCVDDPPAVSGRIRSPVGTGSCRASTVRSRKPPTSPWKCRCPR